MAVLKGGIRFPVDPLVIGTLRFYDLCPDQLPPNFYRMVSCVSRLNQLFGLQLNHYDINFMYSLCSNIDSDYYSKTWNNWVQLISCLLDSNRNSAEEFVRVSDNWFVEELPCAFSPHNVGWSHIYFIILILLIYQFWFDRIVSNQFLCYFRVNSRRFKKDVRVVHVRDLNFVLRSKNFVHWDGQLRASHLILEVDPVYSTWQDRKSVV